MPLIELSAITGPLAKMAAEKAFARLSRSEAAIEARRRLRMPSRPKADDFEAIYRHALVEWGVFKPEPVLDFFRKPEIYDAFYNAWHKNDPGILEAEAREAVALAEETGAFRRLEYDPRRELIAFTATFNLIVDYTRTAAEARHDADMARMQARLDEMYALLQSLTATDAPRAAIGGDVHFSGQFQNVIINLLSQLQNTTQRVGQVGEYIPPALPPLDEDSRPPLPPPHLILPAGSRIPYERNPLFTGREDDLRALAAQLLFDPLGRPAVIATGIGGIGKTQLAVEFAYRYGRYLAGGVHWVSLADEDPDAVGREVMACGERLGLWPPDDKAPAADKIERTRDAWLAVTPRLLIFDNCENPAVLEAWRPVGGGARVLVTSRNDEWPAGFAALAVATLPRDQSIALLREYLADKRRESDAALGEVAAEVGDLPLALTLAGSYLAANPSIAAGRYLSDLRRAGPLEHLRPRDEGTAPHRWTKHDLDVARTFELSLRRLAPDSRPVDALAVPLLAGAALLVHGEPFPWALAAGIAAPAVDDDEAPGAAELPDAAVRRLLALGLLERAGVGQLRLHRLLAAFAAAALVERMDAARAAVEGAVFALAAEQNRAGLPAALRTWEIHLRFVVDAAFAREDESAARLCNEIGYYLLMSGDLAAARPYVERALAIWERVLGPEHPDTASSLNNLGFLLRAQGDLAAARPYYERALAIRERVLGPEHPDTAGSLNNLGFLLQAQGDLPAARPYVERALAIRERVLGPEHPDTARSLNNLGSLLQDLGDLTGARPYYERALAISERVLGPEHPNTALSLNNLGSLLQAQGDLAAARPYYERALAISELVLGPEHPDTALSLNNLGGLLQAQGDLAAARPYYERALAIYERVLGPEHPDTASSLNNLGFLLQAQGDLAAARSYYERALAIFESKLGPNHPHTRIVRGNLAAVS